MSVRPRDAYETAQQFSLRNALGGAQAATVASTVASRPAPSTGLSFDLRAVQQMQKSGPLLPATTPPAVVQAPSGLSLRFDRDTQSSSLAPSAQAPAAVTVPPPTGIQAMPSLTFAARRAPTPIQSAKSATRDAAVMRLTAQVEDLAMRLKKAQVTLQHTESQLTRTSHVLCQERQASEKAIASYKKDLVVARDAEATLRTELAGTKKSALKTSTFFASVDSALASDEQIQAQQRSMHEVQTKVTALSDFKAKLGAEVSNLQEQRAAAQMELDAARVEQEEHALNARAAAEQMTTMQISLDGMKKEQLERTENLAAARVEEATLAEAVSSLHVTREVMDKENAKVGAATDALLLEQQDAARTLAEVNARLSEIADRKATEAAALEKAVSERAAVESAAKSVRRGTVTGAPAPQRALCSGIPTNSVASAEAHRTDAAAGRVAALFSIDAPVELALKRVAFVGSSHAMIVDDASSTGGAPTPKEDSRTTAMVQAVVGDLKTRLTEISMREPVWRVVAPLA